MIGIRNAALAALFAITASAPLAAQGQGSFYEPDPNLEGTRVGTRAADFLKMGVGARALALGSAYTAMAEDIYSLYWNPAGLAHIESLSAAFTHAALFEEADITHQFAGVALPALGGVVGVSGIFFDSGDIPRTSEEFPLGGDPELGDVFSWTGTAIGLHYARFITDRLSIGFAGKVVGEGIAGATANYFGFDAGVRFNTGLFGTTIGAALTNVGSEGRITGGPVDRRIDGTATDFDLLRPLEIGIRTTAASLPTAFHFGIQTSLVGGPSAVLAPSPNHRLVALVQVDDGIDSAMQPSFAAEYAFREILFARIGKRMMNEPRTGFRESMHGASAGFGVRMPLGGGRRAGFDFGYVDMGELENIRVFSFEFVF